MPRVKTFDEDQVLEKAMELFWKQGYNATSMQNLVDALGINRASLYDTFKGKKELFVRAFQRYRARSKSFLKETLLPKADIREGFRAVFLAELEGGEQDCDSKGCFVVNSTTELAPQDEEITAIVCENRQVVISTFQSYLDYGKKAGQLSPDKDTLALAHYFFTFFNGLKVISKLTTPREELEKMVETALGALD